MSERKLNLLIIGAGSNLGNSLIKFIKDCNIFVAGIENANFYFNGSSEILDNEIINNTFDIIINTMGDFGGNDTSSFYETEKINTLGILKVCELAKLTHCQHLIHISSISKTYNEQDPYYGIYSISKKHGDELLKLYCKLENIPYTILMPSQIFDIEGKCKKHQVFLYTIIEKIKNNENITIYGENDFKRNYVYIEDVCRAICEIIKCKTYGEFSFCAKKDTSMSKIFSITKDLTNSSSQLIFDKTKDNVLDLPKSVYPQIYFQIDCEPILSIEKAIKLIIEEKQNV